MNFDKNRERQLLRLVEQLAEACAPPRLNNPARSVDTIAGLVREFRQCALTLAHSVGIMDARRLSGRADHGGGH